MLFPAYQNTTIISTYKFISTQQFCILFVMELFINTRHKQKDYLLANQE